MDFLSKIVSGNINRIKQNIFNSFVQDLDIQKGYDDELEKGKWNVGDQRFYHGTMHYVAELKPDGSPRWRRVKKTSGADDNATKNDSSDKKNNDKNTSSENYNDFLFDGNDTLENMIKKNTFANNFDYNKDASSVKMSTFSKMVEEFANDNGNWDFHKDGFDIIDLGFRSLSRHIYGLSLNDKKEPCVILHLSGKVHKFPIKKMLFGKDINETFKFPETSFNLPESSRKRILREIFSNCVKRGFEKNMSLDELNKNVQSDLVGRNLYKEAVKVDFLNKDKEYQKNFIIKRLDSLGFNVSDWMEDRTVYIGSEHNNKYVDVFGERATDLFKFSGDSKDRYLKMYLKKIIATAYNQTHPANKKINWDQIKFFKK